MKRQEFSNYCKREGTNEAYLAYVFNTVNSQMLSQLAKGELDMKELAKRLLENRGLDIDGKWVGPTVEIN